jgi:hypothetical protein
VNLGLRDDLVTPWKERHNRLAVFDPSNGGNLVPVGTLGYPADTVTDGRYTNLAPRIGFAYSLDGKTVVRGAFGIFYAYETHNSNPQSKNAPFNGSLIATNSTGVAGYAAALPISAGFPAARPDLFSPTGTAFQVFRREYPNPSANKWNINVQRQFSSHDNRLRQPRGSLDPGLVQHRRFCFPGKLHPRELGTKHPVWTGYPASGFVPVQGFHLQMRAGAAGWNCAPRLSMFSTRPNSIIPTCRSATRPRGRLRARALRCFSSGHPGRSSLP